MKKLAEFIKEINDSKELQEEVKNAKDIDAANAFLKKHDCDASADDLAEYIRSQNKDGVRELSDEEASVATGGIWVDFGFGWVWLDDDIPGKMKKEEPVLPERAITILPED